MLYEPKMETAKNYEELRTRLKSRGYKNTPVGASPSLDLKGYKQAPIADTSSCKVKQTMLRKK